MIYTGATTYAALKEVLSIEMSLKGPTYSYMYIKIACTYLTLYHLEKNYPSMLTEFYRGELNFFFFNDGIISLLDKIRHTCILWKKEKMLVTTSYFFSHILLRVNKSRDFVVKS